MNPITPNITTFKLFFNIIFPEFIIYFFKSENEKDGNKFIDDFNERDITFRVDDIKILDILLIANSLEYTIKDSDYDDIDKLFPLEEN